MNLSILPKGLAEPVENVVDLQRAISDKKRELENKLTDLKRERRVLFYEANKLRKLQDQIAIIEEKQLPKEILEIAEMFPMITSTRQLEVIYCMSKFMNIKKSAETLFISPKTIKHHRTQIFKVIGVMGEKEVLKIIHGYVNRAEDEK